MDLWPRDSQGWMLNPIPIPVMLDDFSNPIAILKYGENFRDSDADSDKFLIIRMPIPISFHRSILIPDSGFKLREKFSRFRLFPSIESDSD